MDQAPICIEVLTAARSSWTSKAISGDCRALAFLALIEHQLQAMRSPSEDAAISTNSDAQNLLRRSMANGDADFLVELGDELIVGFPFPRNISLAEQCFELALTHSEIKGSYALGRLAYALNRAKSKVFFERAAHLGHVPSRAISDVSFETSKNPIFKLVKIVTGAFRLDLTRALASPDRTLRFWRYKDDLGGYDMLENEMPIDRQRTFPWSTPIATKAFAVMVRQQNNSLAESRRISIRPEQLFHNV